MFSLLFCIMVIPVPLFGLFEDIGNFEKVFEREEIIERQNNPNINTLNDEFIVHFDIECLSEKESLGRNIIGEFLTEFPCYSLNEEKEDKFPEIMDKWIVVNKDISCNNDNNKEIIWNDFCLENVEENEIWEHDSDYCDSCTCESRSVSFTTLWNLNDACPDITNGVNYIDFSSTNTDPNFDIIIMDKGIFTAHNQFTGLNITQIYDGSNGAAITSDHGTFIAGIIAGRNVGVLGFSSSSFIKLVDVKMPNITTLADFLSGFDSIIRYLARTGRKAIINFSFSFYGNGSFPMQNRIEQIYNLNGYIFCSAGNDNIDASLKYPASSPYTITVGNHRYNLLRATSSNYGDSVDIYGPGTDIYSTTIDTPMSFRTGSGTSFSAPFVAGVAANILASNPDYSMENLLEKLLDYAAYDVTDMLGSTDLPRVQISCDEYSTDDTLLGTCISDISGNCYIINENSFDGSYSGSYKQFCDGNGYRVSLLWSISNNCTNINDIDIDGFNIPGSASVTYKYDTLCC